MKRVHTSTFSNVWNHVNVKRKVSSDPLPEVPVDVWAEIFSYLNPVDKMNLGLTCKQTYAIVSSPDKSHTWKVCNFDGSVIVPSNWELYGQLRKWKRVYLNGGGVKYALGMFFAHGKRQTLQDALFSAVCT